MDRPRPLLNRSWGALADLGAPLSFLGAPSAVLEVLLAAHGVTLTTLGALLAALAALLAAHGPIFGHSNRLKFDPRCDSKRYYCQKRDLHENIVKLTKSTGFCSQDGTNKPKCSRGPLRVFFATPRALLGHSWGFLVHSRGSLGTLSELSWAALGDLLAAPVDLLAALCGLRPALGRSEASLGPLLGCLWPVLGQSWGSCWY